MGIAPNRDKQLSYLKYVYEQNDYNSRIYLIRSDSNKYLAISIGCELRFPQLDSDGKVS